MSPRNRKHPGHRQWHQLAPWAAPSPTLLLESSLGSHTFGRQYKYLNCSRVGCATLSLQLYQNVAVLSSPQHGCGTRNGIMECARLCRPEDRISRASSHLSLNPPLTGFPRPRGNLGHLCGGTDIRRRAPIGMRSIAFLGWCSRREVRATKSVPKKYHTLGTRRRRYADALHLHYPLVPLPYGVGKGIAT